jgi:hypothetical protein
MSFSLKKLIHSSPAKGQVIDGHLILSFPNATEPVVWRMELDKIGTASFEVKQDTETNTARLVLKPKKGTAEVIAPFATREEAVEALMLASNAMQNAQTTQAVHAKKQSEKRIAEYQDNTQTTAGKSGTEATKWFLAVFGAIVVIGLYYYLTTLIPENINSTQSATVADVRGSDPASTAGVPMSADDFLGGL